MKLDLILENSRIIDGTGRPAYIGDVGIYNGMIVEIGTLKNMEAEERIDINGDVLCPGLVDSHCHTDMYAEQFPEALGKITGGRKAQHVGDLGEGVVGVLQKVLAFPDAPLV